MGKNDKSQILKLPTIQTTYVIDFNTRKSKTELIQLEYVRADETLVPVSNELRIVTSSSYSYVCCKLLLF